MSDYPASSAESLRDIADALRDIADALPKKRPEIEHFFAFTNCQDCHCAFDTRRIVSWSEFPDKPPLTRSFTVKLDNGFDYILSATQFRDLLFFLSGQGMPGQFSAYLAVLEGVEAAP